eukprot:5221490-Prymnesium_polylepis.1
MGSEGKAWTAVLIATGHAGARKAGHSEKTRSVADAPGLEAVKVAEGGICGFTHALRVGQHAHVEHSAAWRAHAQCSAGCGVAANLRHVVTGQCVGMRGRTTYVARMAQHMHRIVRAVPKP